MSIRRWLSALPAAGVGLAVMAAAGAAPPAARAAADALGFVVPNVCGKGIPLAFSGLDDAASLSSACVGVTREEPLTIQFLLPKDPVLRIYLPPGADDKVRYLAVTNDLLVATIPSDPMTVVMGFASANVVVGRVPPGGRVSLQGGDMNCTIMRKDVGDRTQFAFAWDPKGGKAAADAALAAVGTSIDTLVEQRLEIYKKLPAAPESASPLAVRTLAKAYSVLRCNVYAPEGRIKVHWASPGRAAFRAATLTSTAMSSLGLQYVDGAAAKECLKAVCGFQGPDGFLPGTVGLAEPAATPQPAPLAWAAWRVYFRSKQRDREFLQQSYDVVSKEIKWFVNHWMVGENSGLFARKADAQAAGEFYALDVSCVLLAECRALQEMAQVLGFREDAKTWADRAEGIAAAARRQFWNEEKGFFFNRKVADGEWAASWSSDAYLTLWSGLATKEQAARLVGYLADPKKFGTPLPVPRTAQDEAASPAGAWASAALPATNLLVVEGLHKYGYAKEADDLRRKTLDAIARGYGSTGCLFEMYDSTGRKSPAEFDPQARAEQAVGSPEARDVDATAAVFVEMLLHPKP